MTNVAGEAKYAEVVAKLRDRLLGELKQSGDPRLVDDGKYFENPPLAGPVKDGPARAKRKR